LQEAALKGGKGPLKGQGFLFGPAEDNVDRLTDTLEASAARIRRFNRQITDLANRGLRKDLISQLIGLGPEAGADLAKQLSDASDAQLRELNAAQKQLADAAKKFGQDSADKMFDAGKQAANGFLAGLKAQQKDIEALMISIAKGLTTAIKQALKIKSPSRVFKEIGEFLGQGLINGIRSMTSPVASASERLAKTATNPFSEATVPLSTVRTAGTLGGASVAEAAASADSARTSGGVSSDGVTINNNFVINEVGDGLNTARRVVSRLALAANVT